MTNAPEQVAAPVPAGHREVGGSGRYTLHAFASPGIGSVNCYWLETRHGIILFDGQRQLSQAHLALQQIERLQKPITAIFVSHEHPDHVGGLGVFAAAAPDAPIYASAETDESIAANRFGYYGLAKTFLGDDFPDTPLRPTAHIAHAQIIEVDGLALQVHEFGPGEAASMTGLRLDNGEMIVADVLANRMTPFTIEGRMLPWIDQLVTFRSALPDVRRVYPGHGDDGDADTLVEAQAEYLITLRDLVEDARNGRAEVDDATRDRLVADIERRYPGRLPVADVPGLLAMSVDAIARELAEQEGAAAS